MFCPKCGTQVEREWKLCPKYGVRLILEPPRKKPAAWEDVNSTLPARLRSFALSFNGVALFAADGITI